MPNLISDSLNKTMSRKEFLQMGFTLLLAVIGVQNLISVLQRHTYQTTTPTNLLEQQPSSNFGTRKFGQ